MLHYIMLHYTMCAMSRKKNVPPREKEKAVINHIMFYLFQISTNIQNSIRKYIVAVTNLNTVITQYLQLPGNNNLSATTCCAPFSTGGVVLLLLFVREWLVVTAKAHRYLLTRRDLGDWVRLLAIATVFLGFGGVGLLALVLSLVIVAA